MAASKGGRVGPPGATCPGPFCQWPGAVFKMLPQKKPNSGPTPAPAKAGAWGKASAMINDQRPRPAEGDSESEAGVASTRAGPIGHRPQ